MRMRWAVLPVSVYCQGKSSEHAGTTHEAEELRHSLCLPPLRPYFHIWSSRSPQQLLLLPPCPGVDWHGGHKRPPLFDPDPHQQSAHYRKWSKPRVREVKAELDTLAKEASQSPWRRFLLTGPPQVRSHTFIPIH